MTTFIAVEDDKLCNGDFRYFPHNRNPSSNNDENQSFAYGQCSQDPHLSISACISNFDHHTHILEEVIQCCRRKMHTLADRKLSSQLQERKDSIHKTFVRGQSLTTSLKN